VEGAVVGIAVVCTKYDDASPNLPTPKPPPLKQLVKPVGMDTLVVFAILPRLHMSNSFELVGVRLGTLAAVEVPLAEDDLSNQNGPKPGPPLVYSMADMIQVCDDVNVRVVAPLFTFNA
jgi:hypothetical protein